MEESGNRTFTLPGTWPLARGTVIARGRKGKAVRIQVRNLGGGEVALAYADQDVIGQSGPGSDTYRLPAGEVDVFVLAPYQKMYAVADAANTRVSVATSDALPIF